MLRNGRRTTWKKKVEQYALWERWEELVGSTVAKNARPSSWRNQTLIIKVINHVWIQELQFLRNELLEKIRGAFPSLVMKNIRFELGAEEDFALCPSNAVVNARAEPTPLTSSEVEFARDTARPVGDDETRALIRNIIEKDLALKKRRR